MPKQNAPPQLAVPSDKGTPDCCRSSDTKTPPFEPVVNDRDSKRQKLNAEHGKRSVMQLDASDHADTNAANQCAFCHSCRITEVTGPLLHYYGSGKPVKVEEADQTTVIHVHDQCVDWTPRVYFDGETAMNLKAEVSRASKLRCSNCGQKGAALGCFYKTCRRSYHIPCAFGIPQCRWDLENYHVLCPQHSSKELPCDKSKSQKKIEVNNSGPSQRDCSDTPSEVPFSSKEPREARWTAAPHLTNVWILCGSALSKQDKDLLDNFANLTGATVTDLWRQNVTHVIASTDERGACFRTFKILMATLRGKWVLSIDYSLRFTSAASVLLAVVFVFISTGMALSALFQGKAKTPRLLPDFAKLSSPFELFTAVPVIVVAFTFHFNVHPIRAELSSTSGMTRAVRISLLLCSIIYAAQYNSD